MSGSIKITWNPEAAGLSAPASTSRDARFQFDFRPASLRQSAVPQARAYRSKVQALADSIQSFAWPASGLVQGRSVQADPRLDNKVSARLMDPAQPYTRFLSRGFDPNAASALAAGDYQFEASVGGTAKKIDVTLAGGETNAQVLDLVAQAVNDSASPLQARSVFQHVAGQRLEGSLATGQVLSLDLNPGLSTDQVSLRDTKGHLLSSLDLTALAASTGPANVTVHTLRGDLTASLTAFHSRAVDPNADSGLAAGSYTLNWSMGQDSGTVTLQVSADSTWKAVLENLASRINMEQTRFTAETEKRERTIYSENDGVLRSDGLGLSISANQGKLGERLSLSGADAASQALLSGLGLNATAQPGKDGTMRVDGVSQTRQPGVFDADQGHVRLILREPFAEALPLSVTDSLDSLEQGLSGVVTAYNGLRDLLLRQGEDYMPGLARDWRKPLEDRIRQLRGLGLRETGKDQSLWLDAGTFYTALGREPETVKELLTGDQGLLTTWSSQAATDLNGDPERFLALDALPAPSPLDEIDLERGRRLVDLLERNDVQEAASDKASGRLVDENG